MRAHLKSINVNVWLVVETGWTCLEGVCNTWSKEDCEKSNSNNKGINTIFMIVFSDEFRCILTYETAKEAWDILEVTQEGTKGIKRPKLQMLTSKFEEIKMKEEKTFSEFYAKLCDIQL